MIKKVNLVILVFLFIVTAIAFPIDTRAAEQPIKVFVDGKQINFTVNPTIQNGTTLVPFRPIFEGLGLTVDWNSQLRSVEGSKNGLRISLTIDKNIAVVNGISKKLDVAPKIIQGNTMVPLRFIGEAANKQVNWDGTNRIIQIGTQIKILPQFKEGEWKRINVTDYNGASVTISKLTPTSFYFEINAAYGAHAGYIDGVATIKSFNQATYYNKSDGARIDFTVENGVMIVDPNQTADNYGGLNVTFSGKYKHGNVANVKYDFIDKGIFNEKQSLLFSELVGNDYELFNETFQLINHNGVDLDAVNAKVHTGGVAGLYTIMEGIIMVNDQNEIWAAILDGGDEVRYYTNNDRVTGLPKTIEKWLSRFDTRIVYMSK